MTTNIEIAIGILIFLAGAAIAALVFGLRDRWSSDAKARVLGYRETYEPLFADLWSDEMHRRLTALVVAQRVARSRDAARGLADVLISFIRRRLANAGGHDASFEDVRLALTILGTRAVRRAQAESRQSIDLSGINFRGARLSGVDLQGFRLAQCNFDDCLLAGAKLSRADLSGASLCGVDFHGADLRDADFSEGDIGGADLTGARVGGANFTNVNVGGAILTDAMGLTQEQLDQAFGDTDTAIPERLRFAPGRPQRTRNRISNAQSS
jgi:uncharacterized protein YjbI with pentapeptide repeats